MVRLIRFDDDHPFTGWHALALVTLFFAVIISVNIVMAVFATSTFPGLVVRNSYVASQNYNETLARAREQEATGLTATLAAEAANVRFRLADRSGQIVHGLTVTARAGRPSTAQEDTTLDFTEDGAGYRATKALPAGRWEITIDARRGDEAVWRQTTPLYIAPPEVTP